MKTCTNPLCIHLPSDHKGGCRVCQCQKFCTVKLTFKDAKYWIDRGQPIDLDIVKEQSKIAVAEYQKRISAEKTNGEVLSDCRTEEGITIGLIDSMIFIARILAKRDLYSENLQSALRDFHNDEDIKFLTGR